MRLSGSAPASGQPDGKADHKADQQRASENSYDALIPPMGAHTTDTTPFEIPNAITHTLLLPQNSALAGVGSSSRELGDLRQLFLGLFYLRRLSCQMQKLLHMVFGFFVAGFLHKYHAQHVLQLGSLMR